MARLTLVLAQAPWAPDGDLDDHIDLYLCLNGQGRIDGALYESAAEPWIATRHQPGQPPHQGKLMRVGDDSWALRSTRNDDEPLWDFIGQIYRPGEVVLLRQPDGTDLLFRIVAVEPDDPTA